MVGVWCDDVPATAGVYWARYKGAFHATIVAFVSGNALVLHVEFRDLDGGPFSFSRHCGDYEFFGPLVVPVHAGDIGGSGVLVRESESLESLNT